jgi:hypothetical protein
MLTVTIVPHGQNGMKVVGEFTNGRYLPTAHGSRCDKGDLAAKALRMAMSFNNGEYVILGPDSIIAKIPEGVRSKFK